MKTVERLKKLENPLVPRTLPDHNLLRRFGLLRVESGNNMVEKLVKPGTNLDLFLLRICSTLFMIHILRRVTLAEISCRSTWPLSLPISPRTTSTPTEHFVRSVA